MSPYNRPRRPRGGADVYLYSSFNLGARWGGCSTPRLDRFTPVKTRYPLNLRLGGPQGRSGRVWKISSPPPRFDPRTVQPVCAITTPIIIFKISFNIILPYTSRSLSFSSSHQHPLCTSLLPHTHHLPRPSHCRWQRIFRVAVSRQGTYQVFVGQAVCLPSESRDSRQQCSVMHLCHELAI